MNEIQVLLENTNFTQKTLSQIFQNKRRLNLIQFELKRGPGQQISMKCGKSLII